VGVGVGVADVGRGVVDVVGTTITAVEDVDGAGEEEGWT
jgi:hypothetical protein